MVAPVMKKGLKRLARRCGVPLLTAAAALCAGASAALAHAGDRGFVLLLPTGYYILGGALAVAVSFAMLTLLPAGRLARLAGWRAKLTGSLPEARLATSLVSFLVLCGLLWSGFAGSRDPLSNPLPLVFWTVWWTGLTLAVGLFGNLWRWLDPWYGPWRLVSGVLFRDAAPLRLPQALGVWPALAVLFAFAWFELVDLAPEDPQRLAIVVGLYWIASFAGMLLFGHAQWTRRAECFSVFFGLVARLSPLGRSREGGLDLSLPGARAAASEPLAPSATLFLLLALAAVSFDGLSRTFAWLSLLGINPLEFPGRSAVLGANTLGLLAAFAALAGAFYACVWLGGRLAGSIGTARAAGLFVWSLLPIALAYHFAHYLTALVINGQYALAAVSDPLSRGWNLFGTAGYHVLAGATAGHESAWLIWNSQAAAIVAGHVLGVAIAHVQSLRLYAGERRAAVGELPLAALMVGYTVLGLWLLSAPTGY